MNNPTSNLEQIAENIREELSAKDAAREKMLPLCRETIRHIAYSIRALRRGELEQAENSLHIADTLLNKVVQELDECEELRYSGFIHDAQKEYDEADVTLTLIRNQPLPSPAELKISPSAYLKGMREAVGELRHYLLDAMRQGDISRGEELLEAMDDIYRILVTMDFPDALTRGLKRTTDIVRGILEKTRGDLTLAIRQNRLEEKLKILEQKVIEPVFVKE